MRPRRCRPPVEHCLGVRPRKAAKWRADLNSLALATVATMAEAVILPTPGMVARRRLASLLRCQARIAWSISLIRVCRSHNLSADPGFRRDARVGIIVDDGDQLGNPPDTQRRHDTEFAEAASDQIRQHGLLLDEELARAVEREHGLLLGRLDCREPHRRATDRF